MTRPVSREIVAEVVRLYHDGYGERTLARQMEGIVSEKTIRRIIKGQHVYQKVRLTTGQSSVTRPKEQLRYRNGRGY